MGMDVEQRIEEAAEAVGGAEGLLIGGGAGDGVAVEVDEATMLARSALPTCSGCGAIARPNILMFGDWDWDVERAEEQQERYAAWLERVGGGRVVAIELGAGLAIPTVRNECE